MQKKFNPRGNPNLKKAHESMEINYEQIEEVKRCMVDPAYFIRKYIWIMHPKLGRIKFDLYDYQEELVRSYQDERYNIVLSARQTGKTETSTAYMVWFAIFHDAKTILVVSKDAESAKEIIKKVQMMYEGLPHWLKPGIQDDNWNKHTAEFDNDSRIVARTTTGTSGRGLAISLLYCDELAFVKPHIQHEFWDSVFPTLSCVAGDTIVLTNSGFARIKDLFVDKIVGQLMPADKTLKVLSDGGLTDISHTYISPASKTLTVQTETGRELTVTPHHPLMKLTESGGRLTKTEELQVGDYLRIDTNANIFGNTHMGVDESYMLGGYIAEGWINQGNTIWISNSDVEFRDVYLNNGFREDKNPYKIRLSSQGKIREWADIGIEADRKCHNKIIPSEVLKFDKSSLCNFIAGMFDGDGSVTNKSINYTSTSKQLVQELQILLDNLGIVSRIYRNDSKVIFERDKDRILPQGTKLQSLRDSWGLNIPLSQYSKFQETIPIRIIRKQNKLKEIINIRNQDSFKQYYVPVSEIKPRLHDILMKSGKSKEWYRENGIRFDKCLDGNPDRKLTKKKINDWLVLIDKFKLPISNYNKKFLQKLGDYYIRWEKIRSVVNSYTDATYDFTVPKTGIFTQNGIMGSNTGGGCIISSTPNGDNNLFSTLWRGAEGDVNGFYASRIYWDQPPGRDEEYKQSIIDKMGVRKWLQEYECEFISSDNSLFDTRIIQVEQKRYNNVKIAFTIEEQEFYKPISQDMAYLVGVDPSTGNGNDYSVIEVYEFPTMVQIMEYRSNTVSEVVLYSHLKKVIGFLEKYSNDVYFSVESNGVGRALIALYMQDESPPLYSHFMSEPGKNKLGYTTTSASKRDCAIRFKNMFERREMTILSPILYNEMKSYIRKGDGFNAQTGATDDCISAVFVVLRMLDEIAQYDPRAYEKLYRFTEQAEGNEWYTDPEYQDAPIPAGVF